MGSAVSVVEAVGLETSVEAFGQISDAGELALANDRKRAVVGIGTGAVAGGMMDLVLATSAIATGPLGVIASAGVSMLASQTAKTFYDSSS
jgi:hypothetical protein